MSYFFHNALAKRADNIHILIKISLLLTKLTIKKKKNIEADG